MKKLLLSLLAIILFFCWAFKPLPVKAIYDPLSVANNKVGIHILFPDEIDKVADLVNSSGGDWGYVTVPLRTDDRNREKWLDFFKKCKEKHIIPIIRLATTMTSSGWQKPDLYDSLDMANFLNDMPWPTKNRYIVVYNEPNHASEWGGVVDPTDYARVLKYTSLIFKERSSDFFILAAGFDAAAPNKLPAYENLYNFVYKMDLSFPDVFNYIDGWTSHSYPNPGFLGSPTDGHQMSIVAFTYELNLLGRFINKKLPVFITETGWDQERLGDERVANFFQLAFSNIWNNERVVAVTPFLLMAGEGDFKKFSLLKPDGSESKVYLALKNMNKLSGSPEFEEKTLFANVLGTKDYQQEESLPEPQVLEEKLNLPLDKWQKIFSWLWYTKN